MSLVGQATIQSSATFSPKNLEYTTNFEGWC